MNISQNRLILWDRAVYYIETAVYKKRLKSAVINNLRRRINTEVVESYSTYIILCEMMLNAREVTC